MLTKEQIENYLKELNTHLAEQNIVGEVVLCGGAVMTLAYDARFSTKDIDGIFAPSEVIRQIIKTMAVEHGLEEDWFNDAAKGFIDTGRMNFTEMLTYSHLKVSRPGDKEMLALKLASAREDSKDADDTLFLMGVNDVSSLEEVYDILEHYIPPARLTPMASFFAEEIYNRYIHKKKN